MSPLDAKNGPNDNGKTTYEPPPPPFPRIALDMLTAPRMRWMAMIQEALGLAQKPAESATNTNPQSSHPAS